MSDAAGGEIGHREVTSTVPIRAALSLWEGSPMSAPRRSPLALLAAVALCGSASAGFAQVSPGGVPQLAIEREPPTATKPVFAPPIVVPPAVPGAAAGVTAPPVPPPPILIPPGPGPVAVPVPVQSPVTVAPIVPPAPVSGAAAAPVAPAPQAAQASPPASGGSAGSDPAPTQPPVPPSSEPPTSVPAPAPAPQIPSQPTPPGPTPPSGPIAVESAPVVPAAPTAPAEAPKPAPAPDTPPLQSAPAPVSPPPPPSAPTETPAPAPKAKLIIEEVTVDVRPALFVTGTTTWEKAETLFDKVFQDLGEAVGKLGVTPTSGPIVEYVETDDDSIGYRVMVPIKAAPKGKLPKGVKVGETRGGKALLFRNEGPLEDLEEVYGRIDDELAKRNLDNAVIVEAYDEDALASPEDRSILHIWVLIK